MILLYLYFIGSIIACVLLYKEYVDNPPRRYDEEEIGNTFLTGALLSWLTVFLIIKMHWK